MVKILLVEDDKSLREIYGVRLLAEGYDIVSAGDGEEALAMAIKDRPDLILSDVMMPKISGFDMLDILRSTTETKDIKVIMMTALSREEQRQRGVSLGADRYLVKSQVGIEDVVRTVHEVLSDAPVSSGTTDAPTPQPAPAVAPAPTPTYTPPTPAERLRAPVYAPTPEPAPAAQATPTPSTPPIAPSAPQPSAPISPPMFSTPVASQPPAAAPEPTLPTPSAPPAPPAPKPTLANRVIEPLPSTQQNTQDFGNLMNQELSQASPNPFADKPPVEPGSNSTNIPPAPPTAITPTPPGLQFEETPLPPAPVAPATGLESPQSQ